MTTEILDKTVCTNKATGEVIGQSPLTTDSELDEILKQSRSAFPVWSSTPLSERKAAMVKVRNYLVEHTERITEIISRENGKTRVFSLIGEVFASSLAMNYFIQNSTEFLADKPLKPASFLMLNKRSYIQRVPYGVIGIISPWNYPLTIPITEVVKALLAGNTVILKTATETQMVGRFIEEAVTHAGLPEGTFTYINMRGSDASNGLLNGGVDKLIFTGSVAVGKKIMEMASRTLTPVVLELGGNDAMIICDDADLDQAAMGAVWAGYSNCGQTCGGVERVYVHENVYDSFLAKLKPLVSTLRIGYEENFDKDMGVLTTAGQVEAVQRHIDDALESGAEIFAQSEIPSSNGVKNCLPATVLVNVDHSMKVMREETFGPVLAIMRYNTDEEAIRLANDSDLGLTGSVWSNSPKRADDIARQINAGAVNINDHMMSHGMAETPWGGFKNSGLGRTHGKLGFDEMTQPKVIVRDILPFRRRNMWWHPFDRKAYEGFLGIIKFRFGKGLTARVKGGFSLLRMLNRYWTNR